MKQLNWYLIFGETKKIPDGKTVTPTDDIQIWLHCADIWDKAYTALADVIADTTTLSALMASENAVDYLVRSTTWIVGTSVVPIMTSNTTPSGVCSASSVYSTAEAYKAFDGDDTTFWSANTSNTGTLTYQFTEAKRITHFAITPRVTGGHACLRNFSIKGSNNGIDWTTIQSFSISDASVLTTYDYDLNNSNSYLYYRVDVTATYGDNYNPGIVALQYIMASITTSADAMAFIGANDYAAETLLPDATWHTAIMASAYKDDVINVKVPTMTDNTHPSGECFGSSYFTGQPYYQAFDGNTATSWSAASNTASRIGYKFTGPVKVYSFDVMQRTYSSYSGTTIVIKAQGSNTGNDNDWHDISESATWVCMVTSGAENTTYLCNDIQEYQYLSLSLSATSNPNVYPTQVRLQFNGRENGGVQTWLRKANITDKLYTTLAEVLADSTTLNALMASHTAVDYLVTCKGWIDDICADSGAMTAIGNNNYCADTLLADEAWRNAICDSAYFESVLNVKVPVMTSNTTPSGECVFSTEYSAVYHAYHVFDADTSNFWNNSSSEYNMVDTSYLGYDFGRNIKVYKVGYKPLYNANVSSEEYRFIARNTNADEWRVISQEYNDTPSSMKYMVLDANNYDVSGQQFAVRGSFKENAIRYFAINQLQFYGREDV